MLMMYARKTCFSPEDSICVRLCSQRFLRFNNSGSFSWTVVPLVENTFQESSTSVETDETRTYETRETGGIFEGIDAVSQHVASCEYQYQCITNTLASKCLSKIWFLQKNSLVFTFLACETLTFSSIPTTVRDH